MSCPTAVVRGSRLALSRGPVQNSLRDWFLLPAISIATFILLVLPTELIARKAFGESPTAAADCLVVLDPKNGIHGIPNSHCVQKTYESQLVDYKFNSCGNRAGMECGPKPPDVYRIVLLGTSVAEGLHVPFETAIASRLPAELSKITGRKIQVYNEGIMFGTPHLYDLRFRYVLAQQPDLILWTITKWDIEHAKYVDGAGEFKNVTLTGPARAKVAGGLMASGFFERSVRFGRLLLRLSPRKAWVVFVNAVNAKFRCVFMLKHFLYESQTQYLKYYLMQRGGADFLRTKPAAKWRTEMKMFDWYAARILGKAKAAGVPVVVTVFPERATAALISRGNWPEGYDPYKFGEDVRNVIKAHGGTYVDVMHPFQAIPNPERYWLPVDRHPTPQGHAILTDFMAKALTNGSVPALETEKEMRSSVEVKK